MSQYLAWICPCCFFGPFYAPISHEDAPHFDSSHSSAATADSAAADGELDAERISHVTDDELPIYTIDDDAQLVEITSLPARTSRTARSGASSRSSDGSTSQSPSLKQADGSRPTLPPLLIDSASSSQVVSVVSSPSARSDPPRWADVLSRKLAAPASSSARHSRRTSATAVPADAAPVTNGVDHAVNITSASAQPSPTAHASALAPVSTALFSLASSLPLSVSSSSASSPASSMLPTQLLSRITSAVQQLTSLSVAATQPRDEQVHSVEPTFAAQAAQSTAQSARAENVHRAGEEEKQQPEESGKQRDSNEMHETKEAGHVEDAQTERAIKGVASAAIVIPTARSRQRSLASSHVVHASSLQPSIDLPASALSISPSVASISPGGSSAPSSPSSFPSAASGVSLSSSVASHPSPRSSPTTASQASTSLPTALHFDSHATDSTPSSALAVLDNVDLSSSTSTNGTAVGSTHRRLSSAAVPTTTALAAPQRPSTRTNPPSPATSHTSVSPAKPSIPAALPSAPAAPVVKFKKGENPLLSLGIPDGSVSVEHISSFTALFSAGSDTSKSKPNSLLSTLASHLTYVHLFNFLISAPRTVTSAVFKHFSLPILARHKPPNPRPSPNAQIGLLMLQFLTDYLVSVATSAASLTFTFAFPRQADSFTLDVPTPDMFVLESRHPTDATLVHPLNTVRKADSEVRRIVFSRTVRVMIGRDRGIVGLGSGDLSVKKVFSFSCDMRYERRVGEVDVDGSGRQVVEDRDGKIRVEGGHYVLARYDDWLVLTVLGQQVQIGLPPFTRANE